MKIGKAAQAANVSVETVRFYERRGLIEKPQKPAYGGFRSYSKDTVNRIQFIRNSQTIGFTLQEIGELLNLSVDPAGDCSVTLGHAEAKLAEVDRKIESLQTMKGALEVLIKNCPGKGALSQCSILGALTNAEEEISVNS